VIVARLVQPVLGNRILGLVDILVYEPASFRFAFRRCLWKRDERGEYVEQPGGIPFELIGHDEDERFQRLAVRGLREHAMQFDLPLTAKRKFAIWRP
jgi:hypothetical protein